MEKKKSQRENNAIKLTKYTLKDDRRIDPNGECKTDCSGANANFNNSRRKPFTYKAGTKMLCVPVDPQPEKDWEYCDNAMKLGMNITEFKRVPNPRCNEDILFVELPITQGDIALLCEEWHIDPLSVQKEEIKLGPITIPKGFTCPERIYLRSHYEHNFPNAGWIWQPPSTMPDHLGRKVEVLQVVGCELVQIVPDSVPNGPHKEWQFIYIVKELIK